MMKTIALAGFAASLLASPIVLAQTGTSSSYGSYGYGQQIPTQSLTPFDRSWNHFNESKVRAEESAEWVRRHERRVPNPF